MKNKKHEVNKMSDKQTASLIEAIKIINELTNDPEKLKNALDRIQSVLKNPK